MLLNQISRGLARTSAIVAAIGSATLLAIAPEASAQVAELDGSGQVQKILGLEVSDGSGSALLLDVEFVGFADLVAFVSEPTNGAAQFDFNFVFNEFFDEPRSPFFAADAAGATDAANAIASFLGTSLETRGGAGDGFVVATEVGDAGFFGPNAFSAVGDLSPDWGADSIFLVENNDIFQEFPSEFSFATFSVADHTEAIPEGSQAIGLCVAGLLAAGVKFGLRRQSIHRS